MINDAIVLNRLGAKGTQTDPALLARLEEKLNIPRYLDDVPKPIKLGGLTKEDLIGTAAEFKAFYNMNYDASRVDDIATIDLSTLGDDYGKKQCSYSVFIVLKSLILLGVTRNTERAEACRNVFMKIISLRNSFISKVLVYDMLESREEDVCGYYYETVCEAVIDCMCTDDEKLSFHISTSIDDISNRKYLTEVFMKTYSGCTPYEFDAAMLKRAKDIISRTVYPTWLKKSKPINIVAYEIVNGEQKSSEVIAEHIKDDVMKSALISKYQLYTPSDMLKELKSMYTNDTGKTTRSLQKLLTHMGDKLCMM